MEHRTNTRGRRGSRAAAWAIGLLAATLAAMLIPAGAGAAQAVTGGKSTLKLDKSTAEGLADSGIKLKAVKPAKFAAKGVNFPITGGELKTRKLIKGTIQHSGGLSFVSGKKRLKATDFEVTIGDRSKLTAEVGKERVSLFKLDIEKASADLTSDRVDLANIRPMLSAAGARALNDKLRTDLFRKGVPFGKLGSKVKLQAPIPKGPIPIEGGGTNLTLDPQTADALSGLGIEAAPIDPATAGTDGKLTFPITDGEIDVKKLEGVVNHTGGLELTDGTTTIELKRFVITMAERSELTAKLDGERVSFLKLDLADAEGTVNKRNVKVKPIEGSLTNKSAKALNAAFDTTAFERGLTIGSLAIKGGIAADSPERR